MRSRDRIALPPMGSHRTLPSSTPPHRLPPSTHTGRTGWDREAIHCPVTKYEQKMAMVTKRPPGTKARKTKTSTALIRRPTPRSGDADGVPDDLRHLLPRRLHRLPLLAPLLQPRRLHQHRTRASWPTKAHGARKRRTKAVRHRHGGGGGRAQTEEKIAHLFFPVSEQHQEEELQHDHQEEPSQQQVNRGRHVVVLLAQS